MYGDVLYEIVGTSEPRQLFGQIENPIEISAKCFKARKEFLMAPDYKYTGVDDAQCYPRTYSNAFYFRNH